MLTAVVPALNAERTVGECLKRLAGADELLVVDGGSTDATEEIVRSSGARLVASPPGRGVQLRAGVELAGGDWLLIVHADTFLEPDWRAAAERHMRSSPQMAGYFRFRLRARGAAPRLLEKLVALRCALLGSPYGDQGLLLPRSLYEQVGGYAPVPMMEDVDMVRRIGRSRLRAIDADAWTSADKWQRDGWLGRSARNSMCLLLYRLGASPETVARFYR